MADAFAVNSSPEKGEFIVADPMQASSKPIKSGFQSPGGISALCLGSMCQLPLGWRHTSAEAWTF